MYDRIFNSACLMAVDVKAGEVLQSFLLKMSFNSKRRKAHLLRDGLSLNRPIYKHIRELDNLPFSGSPSWNSLQDRLFYDVPSWPSFLRQQKLW
jgi:hypothetical protein